GIDIPNANTILIDRADRFGLADLYQLRGRVGRAGEQAYAILLLPRDMLTVGDARKRIHAIKQYTALGSGFKIAMRDLEIRGAGNLLGTRQSGHIAQIGFDLYCQLLRQSVERLKTRQDTSGALTTFRADFIVTSEATWASGDQSERLDRRTTGQLTPFLPGTHHPPASLLPAFLPATWLGETRLRIAAYRELAEARSEAAIGALETLWRDRFGRIPDPAARLLEIARIKALAAARGITSVEIQGQRLMLHRNGDYILLEGRRFPRLQSSASQGKLPEAISLLKTL
ncbi:MAG: TRCF domain-containing protein, partial [Verrucomicrobiota bacterium]